MSRNFELMQQLGKEQALLETSARAESFVPEPITPAMGPKIGDVELDELLKVVQRAFLLPGKDAPRTVVFTGLESRNGCSWICARTAEVLASQVTGSVCLLDANLRHPGLHEQFGVKNHYGLADALRQTEPIRTFATPLSRPNLWLVSSGSSSETCYEYVGSDRMWHRVAELRAEFDYVLVDSEAMNMSSDGTMLGAKADGVVVVLKANSSRRQPARQALQDLRAAGVRVLGAVLNQRTFPIPEAIYNKL